MQTYLRLFEEHGLPVMLSHGLNLAGYYVSHIGPLNQVVHVWAYDDLADYEAKRRSRDADPRWRHFQAITEGLVMLQDNRVMKPARFSPPLTEVSADGVYRAS
jgi:hypothetical protein